MIGAFNALKHPYRTRYQTLANVRIIQLPRIEDIRGDLSFVESFTHVPFDIKRIFYIYDVRTGMGRGAHAHKTLQQLLICLSGSFDVTTEDGTNTQTYQLNRPWEGLYVPPHIWASEVNFAPGSVCLVLASDVFQESDYIRNYDQFLALRSSGS